MLLIGLSTLALLAGRGPAVPVPWQTPWRAARVAVRCAAAEQEVGEAQPVEVEPILIESADSSVGIGLSPLPTLTEEEEARLVAGERVHRQQLAKGYGNGFSVYEMVCDPDTAWSAVTDFGRYNEVISTVRTASEVEPDEPGGPGSVCFRFIVSRLRLVLQVRFLLEEARRRASWKLDRPRCALRAPPPPPPAAPAHRPPTRHCRHAPASPATALIFPPTPPLARSFVLADSTGYWQVEPVGPRGDRRIRVWFCVAVRLSARVPSFVISLVSRLGLQKATRWVKDLDECALPEDADEADEATTTE